MTWLNPLNATPGGNNLDTQVGWTRVADGGELTGEQWGFVRIRFAQHKATMATGIVGYASVDYSLPDGTRMHVQSNSGIHQITVFPARPAPITRLPHGFCVISDGNPVIYGQNDGTWEVRTRDVPQAVQPILTDNYLIVTYEGPPEKRPLLVPLVRQAKSLWGNRRYGAHEFAGVEFPVAAALHVEDELPPKVHTLVDNEVMDGEGAALYTMVDTDAILLEPEGINYEPGITDTRGTVLVLQSWRFGIIAVLSDISQFRLCNEVIERTAAETYALVERNVTDVVVQPTGNDAVTTLNAGDDTLNGDEPDAGDLKYIWMDYEGVENFGIDGKFIRWGTSFPEIAGTVDSILEEATFQKLEQTAGDGGTVEKVLAIPKEEGVDYVSWNSALNYVDNSYWRAGLFRKTAGYSGLPTLPTAYWQTDYYQIERTNQEHDRDCTPKVWLDIPWVPGGEFVIFEGTGEGRVNGVLEFDYRRETCNSGGTGYVDPASNHIITSVLSPPNPPNDTWDERSAIARAGSVNDVFNELADPHTDPTANTVDIVMHSLDEAMEASLEYTYTSRHIIDFDSRSQFYAAIKVEVICTGATWTEAESLGHRGYLEEGEQPSYEANIYFEWCWDGEVNQTLLATASVSRPGLEFEMLEHENMYAWPISADGVVYYLPPKIAPAADAAQQVIAVMGQQGTNLHYAGQDVLDGGEPWASDRGIEYSTDDGKVLRSAPKFVPGMLYARTFTLTDLDGALWLLDATKCSAAENDAPDGDAWHYMPELGEAIETEVFHIELRNGELVTWSTDFLEGEPAERDINIHRV